MGFNKRKMKAQRAAAAEKEAAARRATEAQILEDAGRLVSAWNERQSKRMPMLFSPTSAARSRRDTGSCGCAVLPAARRRRSICAPSIVSPLVRALPASSQRCRAAPAGHTLHSPRLSAYPTRASPTNCTMNTRGGFSENDCRPNLSGAT